MKNRMSDTCNYKLVFTNGSQSNAISSIQAVIVSWQLLHDGVLASLRI